MPKITAHEGPSISAEGVLPEPEPSVYDGLTKTELVELCAERELSVSGTKADLMARLEETH
jgi:hypothetical protein